jgi:hypothetical protein
MINVLEIDLRQEDIEIESARARDRLTGRETTSSIAARKTDSVRHVVAALNADFFILETGETTNIQVIDGAFVKGRSPKRSSSQADRRPRSQFAVTVDGKPHIDRFVFSGFLVWPDGSVHYLSGVNVIPDSNAITLFNSYYGPATPIDGRLWGVKEAELIEAGERGDTALYVVRGDTLNGGNSSIPAGGAILAGYHQSQRMIESKCRQGDTVRVVLRVVPYPGKIKCLVGGTPRIVLDGVNIANIASQSEGTSARFSSDRHPRSGIGFSKDSTVLYFVAVDGRQESSVGMSLPEFADRMIALGIYQGLNLDGGGSTALIIDGEVVNTPSDASGERPVGNCILLIEKRHTQK